MMKSVVMGRAWKSRARAGPGLGTSGSGGPGPEPFSRRRARAGSGGLGRASGFYYILLLFPFFKNVQKFLALNFSISFQIKCKSDSLNLSLLTQHFQTCHTRNMQLFILFF